MNRGNFSCAENQFGADWSDMEHQPQSVRALCDRAWRRNSGVMSLLSRCWSQSKPPLRDETEDQDRWALMMPATVVVH